MSAQRSHLCDTPAEELASVITHAIAALMSVVGLVVMIFVSDGVALNVISASVFGSCLILLYSSSAIYHAVSNHKTKSFFQILDHACIYLLIAGSYTPLTLVAMQGAWGWSIFGIVWFCALAGVLLKTCFKGKKDSKLSTALYLIMGWMIVIAIKPVMASIDPAGLAWIVAGGVTYSLGVIFYAWEKLIFNHAIWHLFVLGGSACHVIAYVGYVL